MQEKRVNSGASEINLSIATNPTEHHFTQNDYSFAWFCMKLIRKQAKTTVSQTTTWYILWPSTQPRPASSSQVSPPHQTLQWTLSLGFRQHSEWRTLMVMINSLNNLNHTYKNGKGWKSTQTPELGCGQRPSRAVLRPVHSTAIFCILTVPAVPKPSCHQHTHPDVAPLVWF